MNPPAYLLTLICCCPLLEDCPAPAFGELPTIFSGSVVDEAEASLSSFAVVGFLSLLVASFGCDWDVDGDSDFF